MWSLASLTNSVPAILKRFGDFMEPFILKNGEVCATGYAFLMALSQNGIRKEFHGRIRRSLQTSRMSELN